MQDGQSVKVLPSEEFVLKKSIKKQQINVTFERSYIKISKYKIDSFYNNGDYLLKYF